MAVMEVVCSATVPDTVDIDFHGVLYAITILVHNEELLTVEIEDKDTLDRWRGQFAAQYVEDITSKTGNFKKFAVFVRMLQSAVLQQSDSVFVDLLTLQDLELLKTKKAAANGAVNGPAAAPARQLPASNKRYLILTYASEFDRVHYPLPLLPEDQPDPQRLKAVIKQLRQQLGEVQAAQQLQQQQQQAPRGQQQRGRNSSHSQESASEAGHDAALLSSRIEVLTVQLERERADHRRELRRKAQELQEVQGELSRSRDLVRDLRIRIKALEQQQEAATAAARQPSHSATAAAAAAQQTRRSSGQRQQRGGYGGYGGYGSSYLSGGGRYPGNHVSKYPSRPSRGTGNTPGASRGSSPASSRAQSPGYSRPWAQGSSTPPRPPRPSSAPPKQRFDPTAYVRQKQAREQAASQRGGGSSSRGSSPARSSSSRERERGISYSNASSPRMSGSGVLTPRGLQSPAAANSRVQLRPGSSGSSNAAATGSSRQKSAERQRRSSTGNGYGYLRHTLSSSSSGGGIAAGEVSRSHAAAAVDSRSSSRPGSSTSRQQQQQQPPGIRSSSRGHDRLGAVYGVVAQGGSSSSSSSRQAAEVFDQRAAAGREGPGAASPGRALQGVKDKLSAFMAKQQLQDQQQQQQQQPMSGALPLMTPTDTADPAATVPASAANGATAAGGLGAAATAAGGGGGGAAAAEAGNQVFDSASSELADIDQRLSALQNFLKKAKATVAAS